MRKLMAIFSIVLLVVSMFGQQPVRAATEEYDDIEVGTYDITAKALHADKDEKSGAAGFISEDAKLNVSEDGVTLTITIPHNDMAEISGLQVEGAEPTKDGENWTYELSTLKPILNAQVQYEVPALNMKHDVPFRFSLEGLDDLPVQEEETEKPETDEGDKGETPEEDEEVESPDTDENDGSKDEEKEDGEESGSEDEDEPTGEENTSLENGFYTVTSSYLHASEDKESSMGRYLSNEIFVHVKDDVMEVTIAVNDHETVTKLQVDGKDPIVSKLDGNTRYETFALNSLEDISAYIEYQAPFQGSVHYGNASFRIGMDVENSQKAEEVDQPGHDITAEYISLEDGLYAIDATFINAKNGNASAMARYLGDKAYVQVTDGQAQVFFHIKDNDTVTKLEVNDEEASEEIKNGEETLLSFGIAPLLTEMKGYAEYQAPFGDSIHYGNAEFDIALDKATINEVEVLPIEPEEEQEETEEEPEGNPEDEEKDPVVKESTIDYTIKHATEDKTSSADNFFTKPGTLIEKDGKNYLQVVVTSWSMIGSLEVDGKAVKVLKEDKEKDTATIEFEVPADLSEIVNLSMQVTVPGLYDTTHDARLVMDEKSLGEDVEEKPAEKPKEKPTKPTPEKPAKPQEKEKDATVKGYTIDYVIKHATEDKASAADNFFVKPGTLLKKNGKNYLQVTVTNWSMIDWLEVNGKSVAVVSEDKQADTAVIQFAVPTNLNEIVSLRMKVTVPGLYETEHDARLVMDASSVEEDGKEYVLHESLFDPTTPTKENGSGSNNDTPERPAFGANDDNGFTNVNKESNQTNPQTGDSTKMLLYSLLLLGSLTVLIIRHRRQQLNV